MMKFHIPAAVFDWLYDIWPLTRSSRYRSIRRVHARVMGLLRDHGVEADDRTLAWLARAVMIELARSCNPHDIPQTDSDPDKPDPDEFVHLGDGVFISRGAMTYADVVQRRKVIDRNRAAAEQRTQADMALAERVEEAFTRRPDADDFSIARMVREVAPDTDSIALIVRCSACAAAIDFRRLERALEIRSLWSPRYGDSYNCGSCHREQTLTAQTVVLRRQKWLADVA
jgi:hypothetical protein